MNGVVAVDELTRAYRAVTLGEFRTGNRCVGRSAEVIAEWSAVDGEQVSVRIGGVITVLSVTTAQPWPIMSSRATVRTFHGTGCLAFMSPP